MISSATNDRLYEYYLKHTDTKPVEGVGNGSVAYEMDTGDIYMFDGDTKTWIKQ